MSTFYDALWGFEGELKILVLALTSTPQWAGHHPAHGKVAGGIPRQGAGLGCGPSSRLGHMQEAIDLCFSCTSVFLSFSFSLPSPL